MREFAATCLTGFPQKTMGMVLTNMGNHMDNRCGKPAERQEFIDHVKCFNPRDKIEPMDVCVDKNIVLTEKVKDMSADHQMPASCCSFHLFQDCIVSTAKEVCGDGSAQYWNDMISEVVSFIIQVNR